MVLLGVVSLATSACTREPVDVQCPAVTAGDLVISEIRGDQSGEDTYGQWIEIFNATSSQVDLKGAQLSTQKLDGSGEGIILIRRSIPIAAGGYAVLGQFVDDDTLPDHVDYGYADDYDSDFHNSAAIDLRSCGDQIDRVIYHDLTGTGTWALDGAAEPDATTNDDEANWCVDDRDTMPDPTMLGIPGTPGERNPACGT